MRPIAQILGDLRHYVQQLSQPEDPEADRLAHLDYQKKLDELFNNLALLELHQHISEGILSLFNSCDTYYQYLDELKGHFNLDKEQARLCGIKIYQILKKPEKDGEKALRACFEKEGAYSLLLPFHDKGPELLRMAFDSQAPWAMAILMEYGARDDAQTFEVLNIIIQAGKSDILTQYFDAHVVNDELIDAALRATIEYNKPRILSFLLARYGQRLDLNKKLGDEGFPLVWACKKNLFDIAKLLLEAPKPANPNIFILGENRYLEKTPLYYAIENGSLDMVKLLKTHKAKDDICAVDLARDCKHASQVASDIYREIKLPYRRNKQRLIEQGPVHRITNPGGKIHPVLAILSQLYLDDGMNKADYVKKLLRIYQYPLIKPLIIAAALSALNQYPKGGKHTKPFKLIGINATNIEAFAPGGQNALGTYVEERFTIFFSGDASIGAMLHEVVHFLHYCIYGSITYLYQTEEQKELLKEVINDTIQAIRSLSVLDQGSGEGKLFNNAISLKYYDLSERPAELLVRIAELIVTSGDQWINRCLPTLLSYYKTQMLKDVDGYIKGVGTGQLDLESNMTAQEMLEIVNQNSNMVLANGVGNMNEKLEKPQECPLQRACREGTLEDVRLLLEAPNAADPNVLWQRRAREDTPLYLAVERQSLGIVKLLKVHGAKDDQRATDIARADKQDNQTTRAIYDELKMPYRRRKQVAIGRGPVYPLKETDEKLHSVLAIASQLYLDEKINPVRYICQLLRAYQNLLLKPLIIAAALSALGQYPQKRKNTKALKLIGTTKEGLKELLPDIERSSGGYNVGRFSVFFVGSFKSSMGIMLHEVEHFLHWFILENAGKSCSLRDREELKEMAQSTLQDLMRIPYLERGSFEDRSFLGICYGNYFEEEIIPELLVRVSQVILESDSPDRTLEWLQQYLPTLLECHKTYVLPRINSYIKQVGANSLDLDSEVTEQELLEKVAERQNSQAAGRSSSSSFWTDLNCDAAGEFDYESEIEIEIDPNRIG